MAECSEISLLLGAFEDSELEPNEMQEVAHHLARCDSCTARLADYSTIGRGLRTIAPEPILAGFAAAVTARIDALPQPLPARIRRRTARWWRGSGDIFGSGFAWGTGAVAVAVLTILLTTPYAQRYAARRLAPAGSAVSHEVAKLEEGVAAVPEALAQRDSGTQAVMAEDSQAIISRLEAEMPSVAVWSEPQSDTTVIWLPDQP